MNEFFENSSTRNNSRHPRDMKLPKNNNPDPQNSSITKDSRASTTMSNLGYDMDPRRPFISQDLKYPHESFDPSDDEMERKYSKNFAPAAAARSVAATSGNPQFTAPGDTGNINEPRMDRFEGLSTTQYGADDVTRLNTDMNRHPGRDFHAGAGAVDTDVENDADESDASGYEVRGSPLRVRGSSPTPTRGKAREIKPVPTRFGTNDDAATMNRHARRDLHAGLNLTAGSGIGSGSSKFRKFSPVPQFGRRDGRTVDHRPTGNSQTNRVGLPWQPWQLLNQQRQQRDQDQRQQRANGPDRTMTTANHEGYSTISPPGFEASMRDMRRGLHSGIAMREARLAADIDRIHHPSNSSSRLADSYSYLENPIAYLGNNKSFTVNDRLKSLNNHLNTNNHHRYTAREPPAGFSSSFIGAPSAPSTSTHDTGAATRDPVSEQNNDPYEMLCEFDNESNSPDMPTPGSSADTIHVGWECPSCLDFAEDSCVEAEMEYYKNARQGRCRCNDPSLRHKYAELFKSSSSRASRSNRRAQQPRDIDDDRYSRFKERVHRNRLDEAHADFRNERENLRARVQAQKGSVPDLRARVARVQNAANSASSSSSTNIMPLGRTWSTQTEALEDLGISKARVNAETPQMDEHAFEDLGISRVRQNAETSQINKHVSPVRHQIMQRVWHALYEIDFFLVASTTKSSISLGIGIFLYFAPSILCQLFGLCMILFASSTGLLDTCILGSLLAIKSHFRSRVGEIAFLLLGAVLLHRFLYSWFLKAFLDPMMKKYAVYTETEEDHAAQAAVASSEPLWHTVIRGPDFMDTLGYLMRVMDMIPFFTKVVFGAFVGGIVGGYLLLTVFANGTMTGRY